MVLPSSSIKLASLSTGMDSPVRADSSIFKLTVSMRRKSQGIYLPASMIIISPGTISSEGISISWAFLFTIALGVDRFCKVSKDFSALYS